jgi:nucleotide-binding universal stress UspA family protein
VQLSLRARWPAGPCAAFRAAGSPAPALPDSRQVLAGFRHGVAETPLVTRPEKRHNERAVIALERILCPVDFSEFSAGAAAQAGALARRYGAHLTFLHVAWVQVPPSSFGAAPGPLLLDDAALQALEEDLRAFARPYVDPTVTADVRVVQGAAAPEILEWRGAMAASLIVLGTHGRSGFERLMLGSTAEKVLRKAKCPVLTVPRAAGAAGSPHVLFRASSARPTSRTGRGRPAVGAVAGAGIEGAARAAARPRLARSCPEEGEPFAATLASSPRPLARAASPAPACRGAGGGSGRSAVEDVLAIGTPYKEILHVAAERQADLIVLGVQGRGAVDLRLFGSTTSEVLRRAACPVLTVRAPADRRQRPLFSPPDISAAIHRRSSELSSPSLMIIVSGTAIRTPATPQIQPQVITDTTTTSGERLSRTPIR